MSLYLKPCGTSRDSFVVLFLFIKFGIFGVKVTFKSQKNCSLLKSQKKCSLLKSQKKLSTAFEVFEIS